MANTMAQLWAEYNAIHDEMADAERAYLDAEQERLTRLLTAWGNLNMWIAMRAKPEPSDEDEDTRRECCSCERRIPDDELGGGYTADDEWMCKSCWEASDD